jgi:lipoprotein signal peptidase
MNAARAWVVFSYVLLVVCLIGWPVSALTFARREPQTVLGLSWAALIVGAMGNVIAAQVNRKVEERT